MANLHYRFSFNQPNNHLVDISFEIFHNKTDRITLQLPIWRPGRYELGNFAKNIFSLNVCDEKGRILPFKKISSHQWEVESNGVQTIRVNYRYYAADLNAGSTFLDATQLYVNPVNCCLFIPERMHEPCRVELQVPEKWKTATAMQEIEKGRVYQAINFDQLADSPFIASSALQYDLIELRDHRFHLWFNGKTLLDWGKIKGDFSRFCENQLEMMGPLPGRDYHFMFQILPVPFYHGVEHLYSTVCALGPGNKIFGPDLYPELLGVSSHELFHAWNIKFIRPEEMMPYDFSSENYSRSGWVYEGITTYYGDQFLIRSGVFDAEKFLKTFNEKLKKHFTSFGRFNQSVSDASFDTWLDGYSPGIPHRKTSIYTEGSLCAFMLDMLIREHSNEKYSLDDFMRYMNQLAKEGNGYHRETILNALGKFADYDFTGFYEKYIDGTRDYEPLLRECIERVGLLLSESRPWSEAEHAFGLLLSESGGNTNIASLAPGSPAENAGLSIGDVLVACDHQRIRSDFSFLASSKDKITLHVFHNEVLEEFKLIRDGKTYFSGRKVSINTSASTEQQEAWRKWTHSDFPLRSQ